MAYIAYWGVTAIAALIIAGLLAVRKNRDYSFWMAWAFLVPPLVVILAAMPKLSGPTPRRRSLDEEDQH